jgi:hypothetical protein
MSARTFHYSPNAGYRSKDAASWFSTLETELQGWIADALAGQKRHRLSATNSASVARNYDDVRCDIAQALAAAEDWDGFTIAHQLTLRGWPGDVELVMICNVWSCRLRGRIRARLLARSPNLRGDES